MQGLTKRQSQTLDFIRSSIDERGYPPTLREIGEHMGIRSTNGVNDHLRALERKGYLRREDMKSRALKLVEAAQTSTPVPIDDDMIEVQVLGRVAAGLPVLAEENIIDTVRIDRMLVRGGREIFGLRVTGDSMIEAGHSERRLRLRSQAVAGRTRRHRGRADRRRGDDQVLLPGARVRSLSARERADGADSGARDRLSLDHAARKSGRGLPANLTARRLGPAPRLHAAYGRGFSSSPAPGRLTRRGGAGAVSRGKFEALGRKSY